MSRALLFSFLSFTACASTPARRTEVALSPAEERPPLPVVKLVPPDEAPKRVSTGVIRRAELVKVLDGAPGRFLQHLDTEPRFIGGRFRGWRLTSFFPGDPRFSDLDLQAGDVVLAVNGQSVERPDQLMQVWESLRQGRALVVSVERDGKPRELRFEIR